MIFFTAWISIIFLALFVNELECDVIKQFSKFIGIKYILPVVNCKSAFIQVNKKKNFSSIKIRFKIKLLYLKKLIF